MSITAALVTRSNLVPCQVLGCVRRNVLGRAEGQLEWRFLRGNALLLLLGTRRMVRVKGLPDFEVIRGDAQQTLLFRGGQRQPWWDEDAKLLMALQMQANFGCGGGCIIVQELDGQLKEWYVAPPSQEEAQNLYREAVEAWRNRSRIAKSSVRARVALCPHCPVKRTCDLMDLEAGETSDWPSPQTGSSKS